MKRASIPPRVMPSAWYHQANQGIASAWLASQGWVTILPASLQDCKVAILPDLPDLVHQSTLIWIPLSILTDKIDKKILVSLERWRGI